MWEMRFPSESEVMKSTHNEQSRERRCFFQEKEWLSGPPELCTDPAKGWASQKGAGQQSKAGPWRDHSDPLTSSLVLLCVCIHQATV